MTDAPKKCPVCNGRGYIRCECWPADCICDYGDEDCEYCRGSGDDEFEDDEFEDDDLCPRNGCECQNCMEGRADG